MPAQITETRDAALDAHLAECAACHGFLAVQRDLDRQLAAALLWRWEPPACP